MVSTNPPEAPSEPLCTSDAPSMSESGPALDGGPAQRPQHPGSLVVLALFCTLLLFAIGFTALQNALVTLIAHLILAHAIPPTLHPTSGPFAAASLKATFALSLIGTPFALLPELFHTARICLRTGVDLASLRTRRTTSGGRRRSPTGRLNAQRAMHHVLIASAGPMGSFIYRALWCSHEACDALDPLHATVAAAAGRVLLWSYLFVRECLAMDVSEELESLRQKQLNVSSSMSGVAQLDKQSLGTKDGVFQGYSVV